MAYAGQSSLTQQLGSLFDRGTAAGLSDRELLERFTGRSGPADEAAFAAIVARHGPMVLGLCRQLLGDQHHAEDAFQATFLVLACRARSIRDPDVLGAWLYGVALRTARKARARLARRRQTEEAGAIARTEASPAVQAEQMIERERAEALHHEVDRLPEPFRRAVVACYFEGLSPDEAARRLRWSSGTLRSRLVRARDRLRRGLARRGIVLSTTALGAALAPRSASASVSSLLCDSTTRAAIQFAARRAATGAPAAALAQEVARTMFVHKLRTTALSVLMLATLAAGAGYLALDAFARSREGEPPGEPIMRMARQEPRPPDAPHRSDSARPAPGRMFVVGRVLDPGGRPVPGAVVELVAQVRSPWVGASEEVYGSDHALLGQAQSGSDGRYRLDAPRPGSTRAFQVQALAAAPGYGLTWARLNPDADQPAVDLRLLPERPILLRLVDVTGAPAAGVEVRVRNFSRADDQGTDNYVWLWNNPPEGIRTWPQPGKTDSQGRLALPGIGRGLNIRLEVRDQRYARQDLLIDAGTSQTGQEIALALEPARIIEGRVLADDTGRPIPGAVISAETMAMDRRAHGLVTSKFRADDQGRFLINPILGERYTLGAFPTGGEPYLVPQDVLHWTKGAVKMTHDIRLPRGVLIRGKVTDRGTGRPLPASSIQYILDQPRGGLLWGWQAGVASRDDGSFRIAVAPGRGHLLVFGTTGDYVLDVGPAGQQFRAHAIIPYEVKAGDSPHEVDVALRPGATIKGRVEGPEGRTVTDGLILTTLHIEPFNPSWRGDFHVKVRDGRFEIHGVDPQGASRLHILDPEHEWGATVEVSGKQAGEDLTIRLQPCGSAKARFVGPDGKPVARLQPMFFEFVATPGPSRYSRDKQDKARPAAEADFLANIDRRHYLWDATRTDADGHLTLVALIPGALYRISDFSTVNVAEKGAQVRKDFTVKPGETLDLGEIRIERP